MRAQHCDNIMFLLNRNNEIKSIRGRNALRINCGIHILHNCPQNNMKYMNVYISPQLEQQNYKIFAGQDK